MQRQPFSQNTSLKSSILIAISTYLTKDNPEPKDLGKTKGAYEFFGTLQTILLTPKIEPLIGFRALMKVCKH